MEKKYELLMDDHIEYAGKTLYRIKALKDFGNVKAETIGGYIETEINLSHEGDCWVYDDAKVYDKARVYNNAQIFHSAKVYNNALICNNAQVYEDAEVFGCARVSNNACICENARVYENACISDRALILDNAEVYGNATVCDRATVYNRAIVNGSATVCDRAKVFGEATIHDGTIIGEVSMKYADIYQEEYTDEDKIVTAILTKDNKVLYTIACQGDYTEQEFMDLIKDTNSNIGDAISRERYISFIRKTNKYFKGE